MDLVNIEKDGINDVRKLFIGSERRVDWINDLDELSKVVVRYLL